MINVTPKRFRAMRKEMAFTQVRLATLFGVTDQSIARWEKAQSAIPGHAKVLMWMLYDEHINGNNHAVRDYVALITGKDR